MANQVPHEGALTECIVKTKKARTGRAYKSRPVIEDDPHHGLLGQTNGKACLGNTYWKAPAEERSPGVATAPLKTPIYTEPKEASRSSLSLHSIFVCETLIPSGTTSEGHLFLLLSF